MEENNHNSDNPFVHNFPQSKEKFKKLFVSLLAENLYQDIIKSGASIPFLGSQNKDLTNLKEEEKTFCNEYAAEIPGKYRLLNLLIRPFEDFCRTCIITDTEIETLTRIDSDKFLVNRNETGITSSNLKSSRIIQNKNAKIRSFITDLNYRVPFLLKQAGYEVVRNEEISVIKNLIIKKLARVIHSGYLKELRSRGTKTKKHILYGPGSSGKKYSSDFDDLPDEIKYSNIDNASHIPTKLLSIGYKIRQVKKGYKPIALHLNEEEIETIARVEHMRWSWEKRLNGWKYGRTKDAVLKTHPSLITYELLSESEKEKDRQLVRLIPTFVQDINYEAYPVSTYHIRKLSYAIKPQSIINKILYETRKLNDQIKKIAILTPEIEDMIKKRNGKIEEAIAEVEDSYNYARNIQEAFLPDDFYIRECFPESFVLFMPKDVISGDFYFFSKHDDHIIFSAADCTGHGIPGALISTIGYGIIDQAVNELKLTDPPAILKHLYSRVHRFLREDDEGTGLSDDLDIILCSFNFRTNRLIYSGVKNPLYVVSDGTLKVYTTKTYIEPHKQTNGLSYSSEKMQLKTGDTIYLCSDGYVDQFGGKNHKRYLSERFRSLLLRIQELSMSEQSDRLYEEIESWREENNEDQTDDILVIGIRI